MWCDENFAKEDPKIVRETLKMFAKDSLKGWTRANPRELAALFACSVTAKSGPNDMVARRGNLSIFNAFYQMYPEVFFLRRNSSLNSIC